MKFKVTVTDEYGNVETYRTEEDLTNEEVLNKELDRISDDFELIHPSFRDSNLEFEWSRIYTAKRKKKIEEES